MSLKQSSGPMVCVCLVAYKQVSRKLHVLEVKDRWLMFGTKSAWMSGSCCKFCGVVLKLGRCLLGRL